MSDELVKRLMAFARHPMMDNNCKADVFDVSEAAARIEALTSENAALRDALRHADTEFARIGFPNDCSPRLEVIRALGE